jgi:hypothetical protein
MKQRPFVPRKEFCGGRVLRSLDFCSASTPSSQIDGYVASGSSGYEFRPNVEGGSIYHVLNSVVKINQKCLYYVVPPTAPWWFIARIKPNLSLASDGYWLSDTGNAYTWFNVSLGQTYATNKLVLSTWGGGSVTSSNALGAYSTVIGYRKSGVAPIIAVDGTVTVGTGTTADLRTFDDDGVAFTGWGSFYTGYNSLGSTGYVVFGTGELNVALAASVLQTDPWQLFRAPPRLHFVPWVVPSEAAAGPQVLTATFASDAAAVFTTSAQSSVQQLTGTIADSAAATATTTAVAKLLATLTSAGASTDQITAVGKLFATLTSAAAATDQASAAAKLVAAISEAAGAASSQAAVLALLATVTAQARAGESVSSIVAYVASIVAAVTAGFDVSGIAYQISHPIADITTTGWTASSGPDLYAVVDEVVPDDGDYIKTVTLGAEFDIKVSALTDPGANDHHELGFQVPVEIPSGKTLTFAIWQGTSTKLSEWSVAGPIAAGAPFWLTMAGAEADLISDYTDVHVRGKVT